MGYRNNMGYMRLKEMSEYTTIPYSTLEKLKMKDPDFPKEIRFSDKIILYKREDVDAYITYRASKRAGA